MAGYNYGNNYPQAPPPNPIYPQVYSQMNAPPQHGQQPLPVPQYPGQPQYSQHPQHPQHPQQLQQQPGFVVYPTQAPTALSYPAYPNMQPGYGVPGAPIAPQPNYGAIVEWIPTTPRDAASLSNRAVVAGFEGHDNSPLWVIRARYEQDLIPGKLAIKHHAAYVPWGGNENLVQNIEVCCAPPEKIRWVETRDGNIPVNAIIGGNTASGEALYIGRAREQGSLTPGKVHPSHKAMYISFAGKEVAHKVYEILCTV